MERPFYSDTFYPPSFRPNSERQSEKPRQLGRSGPERPSFESLGPPIINHQGLCPSIYPCGCNSGSPIDLGGVHLSQDRIKTYVDQGVHFQIIISKAVLHVKDP